MMSENEQDQFDPLYLYTQGSTLLGVCQALLFKNHPLPIAQYIVHTLLWSQH